MPVAPPRLILASGSPQRRALLRDAGFLFEVHPVDLDEAGLGTAGLPADLAQQLATLKARAVAGRFPNDVILGADTVVAFGDQPLGKPADERAATRMLRLLSGTTHIVITGVAVLHPAAQFERLTRVMSAVRMRRLSEEQIAAYVRSAAWQGKAGGYGIQDDRNDPFVTRMAGSHSNVVGLPMEVTTALLAAAGIRPDDRVA